MAHASIENCETGFSIVRSIDGQFSMSHRCAATIAIVRTYLVCHAVHRNHLQHVSIIRLECLWFLFSYFECVCVCVGMIMENVVCLEFVLYAHYTKSKLKKEPNGLRIGECKTASRDKDHFPTAEVKQTRPKPKEMPLHVKVSYGAISVVIPKCCLSSATEDEHLGAVTYIHLF